MKCITEMYNQPCDLIELNEKEYSMLKDFLIEYGVEIRVCYRCGDTYQCQIRNVYKDMAYLYKNNIYAGDTLIKNAEKSIENGLWRS